MQPNIIVIANSTRTFFPKLDHDLVHLEYEYALKKCQEKTELMLSAISGYTPNATIILTSFEPPRDSPYGFMDYKMENGMSAIIESCNSMLKQAAKSGNRIVLLDWGGICAKVGLDELTDEKMYYLGKLMLSRKAAEAFFK